MGEWVGRDLYVSEQAANHRGQGHEAPSGPLAHEASRSRGYRAGEL